MSREALVKNQFYLLKRFFLQSMINQVEKNENSEKIKNLKPEKVDSQKNYQRQ